MRPKLIAVEWWRYAQSLTRKPMKTMLTGPVTILNWSFVRDDLPRSEVCRQLALAIRDEFRDLEDAGAAMIHIDEPELREGTNHCADRSGTHISIGQEIASASARPALAITRKSIHICATRSSTTS
ncbi:hypothetical protein [Bradyrhizobium sp. STM 3566]|uniref:hypothetical protein n=1 Tax=Bradyrhizobium sp. STM 3566 TaxID=578928 RepID=UPI00388E4FD8